MGTVGWAFLPYFLKKHLSRESTDCKKICIFAHIIIKFMAEEFIIAEGGKQERYALLYQQIAAVCHSEQDVVANMANMAAMIHTTFHFWWTGFYRVVEDQLVVGPYQGPLACSRIKRGRGVCGKAWEQRQTIIVPDVEKFPGHIACSSRSRSEIVVPVWNDNQIVGVLDIDSEQLETFDETDGEWLEKICQLLDR